MPMTFDETNFPARDRLNDRMVRQVKYTGPSSYAAGGDAFNTIQTGMGEVYAVVGATISNGSAIRVGWFDYTNQKLLWFVPNTGSEATGDLSAYSGMITIYGKG